MSGKDFLPKYHGLMGSENPQPLHRHEEAPLKPKLFLKELLSAPVPPPPTSVAKPKKA